MLSCMHVQHFLPPQTKGGINDCSALKNILLVKLNVAKKKIKKNKFEYLFQTINFFKVTFTPVVWILVYSQLYNIHNLWVLPCNGVTIACCFLSLAETDCFLWRGGRSVLKRDMLLDVSSLSSFSPLWPPVSLFKISAFSSNSFCFSFNL